MLGYLKQHFSKALFLEFSGDFFILLFIIAINISLLINRQTDNVNYLLLYSISFIMISHLILFINELYCPEKKYQKNVLIIKCIIVFVIVSITCYPISYKIQSAFYYFFFSMLTGSVIICWRFLFYLIINKVNIQDNLLFLGVNAVSKRVAEEISADENPNVKVVGFIDIDASLRGKSSVNPKVLGTLEDLNYIIKKEKVKKLIVSLSEGRGKFPCEALVHYKFNGVQVIEIHTFYEQLKGKILVKGLRPSWLLFSEGFRRNKMIVLGKRIFDIVVSTIGLLITLPITMIVIGLIKLESEGPVIYKQQRVGKDGKVFHLLKLRSMIYHAEKDSGPVWAKKDDERVTRVGKIIRKLRIDEIPQMINVLKGDMSFVGPRPERPFFVKKLKQIIPYYNQRHSVKPGITGWAAVNYSYGASIKDAVEKLQYDIYYIKNISLFLDFIILLKTISTIISMKGAR